MNWNLLVPNIKFFQYFADILIMILRRLGSEKNTWKNTCVGITFFQIIKLQKQPPEVKKVFLKISQNLQENTCARASFWLKLQTLGLMTYWNSYRISKFRNCHQLWMNLQCSSIFIILFTKIKLLLQKL